METFCRGAVLCGDVLYVRQILPYRMIYNTTTPNLISVLYLSDSIQQLNLYMKLEALQGEVSWLQRQ
jgi:hypothetical protein